MIYILKKKQNSVNTVGGVTVLVLCSSSENALYSLIQKNVRVVTNMCCPLMSNLIRPLEVE